ncbi:MAG: protein serine/threonine phosphatase, partial [Bacteroidetes bacterium]|nr:protein serine/threonine phosphatase [Bacteroidota bacterium]
ISFLNEAIKEKNLTEPGAIFEHVRRRLIDNISQEERKDGMDGILLCIDKSSGTLTYAAANNAPLLISGGNATSLPYDKMPVGKGDLTWPFSTHTISYKKGDMLYLYTDGYPDQFGGSHGKKFKSRQFEELLLSIHSLPTQEQGAMIDRKFGEWKGRLEQIDDVCVVGIRL